MAKEEIVTADIGKKYPKLRALRELEVRLRPTGLKVPAEALGPIHSPMDAANLFKAVSDRRSTETLMAVYLDSRHRPIGVYEAARGSGNIVSVSMRDLFAPAMVVGANGMIISHNHPSGEADPSINDGKLTEAVTEAGQKLGVPVLDHLVIGEEDAYSFAEKYKHKKVWEAGKSYSVGGWASAILTVAAGVGVLLLVLRGRGEGKGVRMVAGLDLLGAD